MVATGIRSKCVTLLIDGPDDADPWGREALYDGDTQVGPADLGRLFGAFRQVDRHGLCPARSGGYRHQAKGPDADQLWDAEISRTARTTRRTR